MGAMAGDHGYGPYTHGCRCEVCRAAKAERMRKLRAERRKPLLRVKAFGTGRNYVEGITHGNSGYQNASCRCEVCTLGHASQQRRQRLAQAVA